MLKSIKLSKEVYTKSEVEDIIFKVQEELANEQDIRDENAHKLLREQFKLII